MERKYRFEAMGYDFNTIVERVSKIFKIAVKYILSPGKQPERVTARSVLAYWAVRDLGISGTTVGKRLGLSQSAVSPAKAGFKEVNNWFQSIDYLYTIHETHNCMGVPSVAPHAMIQWFKTMTTNEYIRGVKNNDWSRFNKKLWQRNYYEHIIRDEKSFYQISEHIQTNPLKWQDDKYHV